MHMLLRVRRGMKLPRQHRRRDGHIGGNIIMHCRHGTTRLTRLTASEKTEMSEMQYI